MRVIYILWLRQIKRQIRSKSRIIGALGQPLMFMVALGYGFGPIFARAGQGNYLSFLVPGIIAQSVLFTSIFSGIDVIWDRQFGFLKETMVAPVSRIVIMIGRTLGGATVATLQGVIVFCLSLAVGFRPASWLGLPVFVAVAFVIALLFTALGTAIASYMTDFHGFQLIINFLVMPLFFLSGALFPLDNIPRVLSAVIRYNPLTYGVDALRSALINVSHIGLSIDMAVLSAVCAVILVVGAKMFSKMEI